MAIERIIGIDFGTSTSVIRVKRYQDGQPVGDPLEVKQVTFDMGSSMVPTLVQKRNSGETVYFGHDASIPHKGTKTFANFKVSLESSDEGIRQQARELTAEFFTYLAKIYKTQSEGGHLGESSDLERTIISYPVKWSNETKAFMCETAKSAGFPNVEGLDEARAAIQAVTVQNVELLSKKGYFKENVPVTILLIDMGAGTTDLVLCRHTPGTIPKTEILCTWPQKGTALFGGSEADQILRNMICSCLPEDNVDLILNKLSDEKFKAWKESMVSPALSRNERVEEFSALDDLTELLGIEASYSISRKSFEAAAGEYLRDFPTLVNGCLKEAKTAGSDVDLVILTGGHSQWYFILEMLLGTMSQFGTINLDKIKQDSERIIPIALPQETVALGLVYGKLAPSVTQLKSLSSSMESVASQIEGTELKSVFKSLTSKVNTANLKATVEDLTSRVENADLKATIGGINQNLRAAVQNFNLNRESKAAQRQKEAASAEAAAADFNDTGNKDNAADWNIVDKETLQQYISAGERGNVDAQYNLGECYYLGNGAEKDLDKAIMWYTMAANQGHSGAQFRLGECFNNGIGVDVDGAKAVKWYKLAAEQGHSESQYRLGDCYYYGYGLKKDDTEAEKWYKLAAERGQLDAKKQLQNAFAYITIRRIPHRFSNRLTILVIEIDGKKYISQYNAVDRIRIDPGLHRIKIGKKTTFGDDLNRRQFSELSIARGDEVEIAIDGSSANVEIFLNKNSVKSWNLLRDHI